MATWELRNGRLTVGGEVVGIDHRIIAAVVGRFEAESGRRLAPGPETTFLPPSVVDQILALDRALGLARLKAAVIAA